MRNIHYWAKRGKINLLRKALTSDPAKIEDIDQKAWTPLFYAAHFQQRSAVHFLLKQGADPEAIDVDQSNVVQVTKVKGKHTKTSRYLKRKIGFTDIEKKSLSLTIQGMLLAEHKKAQSQNKKLLVVLGEFHGIFKIYQLEKMFVKCLCDIGVKSVYVENETLEDANFPIDLYATKKMGATLIPIDKCKDRENAALDQRDEVMTCEINKANRTGLVMVGSKHLRGILNRVDLTKYHVVPFCLAGCMERTYEDASPASLFSRDTKQVVQIKKTIFSDAKRVSARWNGGRKSKQKKLR
ncbi:MAG: hypothetical protein JSR17_08410 [Proteobacteria bacterium]|nr:hypothetical protein [Pseudomonadota bacterium]